MTTDPATSHVNPEPPQALAEISVIDASDGVAGQFAGRVLAEHGADVLLVEPPGGCATRRAQGAADTHLFWHLNTGKRGLALDRASPSGRDAFGQLIAKADVLICDPTEDAGSWLEVHPGLVTCTIREFAAYGPYGGWQGSEMIHQALSGLMHATGRADKAPLYGFGYRAYYSAGAAAVSAIAGALLLRRRSGRGQDLEIRVHEVAAAMSQNLVAQYSYNGSYQARGPYPGPCDVFECRGGWATLYCRGDRWATLCAALGDPSLGNDPRFASTDALVRNWADAYARLAPTVRQMTPSEFVEKATAARALAAEVNTMAGLRRCEHLASRRFWETTADAGRTRAVLGPMFRFSGTPRRVVRGAPDCGGVPSGMREHVDA